MQRHSGFAIIGSPWYHAVWFDPVETRKERVFLIGENRSEMCLSEPERPRRLYAVFHMGNCNSSYVPLKDMHYFKGMLLRYQTTLEYSIPIPLLTIILVRNPLQFIQAYKVTTSILKDTTLLT
jgi:hypothetical protein